MTDNEDSTSVPFYPKTRLEIRTPEPRSSRRARRPANSRGASQSSTPKRENMSMNVVEPQKNCKTSYSPSPRTARRRIPKVKNDQEKEDPIRFTSNARQRRVIISTKDNDEKPNNDTKAPIRFVDDPSVQDSPPSPAMKKKNAVYSPKGVPKLLIPKDGIPRPDPSVFQNLKNSVSSEDETEEIPILPSPKKIHNTPQKEYESEEKEDSHVKRPSTSSPQHIQELDHDDESQSAKTEANKKSRHSRRRHRHKRKTIYRCERVSQGFFSPYGYQFSQNGTVVMCAFGSGIVGNTINISKGNQKNSVPDFIIEASGMSSKYEAVDALTKDKILSLNVISKKEPISYKRFFEITFIDNNGNEQKLETRMPFKNEKGQYVLNFGPTFLIESNRNCILVSPDNPSDDIFRIKKISNEVIEVEYRRPNSGIPPHIIFMLAIISWHCNK